MKEDGGWAVLGYDEHANTEKRKRSARRGNYIQAGGGASCQSCWVLWPGVGLDCQKRRGSDGIRAMTDWEITRGETYHCTQSWTMFSIDRTGNYGARMAVVPAEVSNLCPRHGQVLTKMLPETASRLENYSRFGSVPGELEWRHGGSSSCTAGQHDTTGELST